MKPWPPDDKRRKVRRDGVTSAAEEMVGTINEQHEADGVSVPVSGEAQVEREPRASALRDHAELTVAGTGESMTEDELNVYRVGEAARKEREAAKQQSTVMENADAAIAQMALESSDAAVAEVVPERAPSSAEQLADVVKENNGATMTPEEVRIFREGEASRLAKAAELTPADATPKEMKEVMRERIQSEATKRVQEAGKSKEQAEKEYFDALAAYQKSRGLLSVRAEGVVGEFTPESLKAMRRRWVRSRANLAAVESETVDSRIKDFSATRKEAVARLKDKHGNTGEAALRARYEKMVRVRSVVLGAEERELAVRTEALSVRDKKTVEKFLDWYDKKTPAPVRIMVSSALMFGATAGVTALATGGSLGLIPAVALFSAGGGAAVRAIASMQKSEQGRKYLNMLAVLPSMAGVIGLATEGLVRGTHKYVLGTEAKAEALLKQDAGLGNLASMRNLEKLSGERKKALVAKERIDRQSRLARTLSSVGFGFLLGHHQGAGQHAENVSHANAESAATAAMAPSATGHDAVPGTDATHTAPAEAAAAPGTVAGGEHLAATSAPEAAPAGAHSSPETASAPASVTIPTSPEGVTVVSTIHTPGEGFGQMIMEFKHNFHDQLGSVNPSPAEAHVLNTDPNELAREIGALTGDGSLVMQPGDQLFADAHGDVWFQAQGHEPRLVFHNDPQAPGGFNHGTIDSGTWRTDAPVADSAPQEDPSAALNRAQYAAHEPVQPVQTVTVEHVEGVKPFDGAGIKPSVFPTHLDTTPTPEAPAAPPHAPEHAPAITPESPTFTNTLGVEVNPAVPAVYAIPQQGGGEVLYMFGGSGNASFLAAQQYAATHPGVEVRFTAESVDTITGVRTPMSGVFRSDESGAIMGSPVDPRTGDPVIAPDPMSFARKLDFTYKPR